MFPDVELLAESFCPCCLLRAVSTTPSSLLHFFYTQHYNIPLRMMKLKEWSNSLNVATSTVGCYDLMSFHRRGTGVSFSIKEFSQLLSKLLLSSGSLQSVRNTQKEPRMFLQIICDLFLLLFFLFFNLLDDGVNK